MKSTDGTVTYRRSQELPDGVMAVAKKRMDGFVRAYAHTISYGEPMTLRQFAESCYLQGCEDMAMTCIRTQPEPLDFSI